MNVVFLIVRFAETVALVLVLKVIDASQLIQPHLYFLRVNRTFGFITFVIDLLVIGSQIHVIKHVLLLLCVTFLEAHLITMKISLFF